MTAHRIRLTDEDLALIIAALSARAAMSRGERAQHIWRLRARLEECVPGNPNWILGTGEAPRETLSALVGEPDQQLLHGD